MKKQITREQLIMDGFGKVMSFKKALKKGIIRSTKDLMGESFYFASVNSLSCPDDMHKHFGKFINVRADITDDRCVQMINPGNGDWYWPVNVFEK